MPLINDPLTLDEAVEILAEKVTSNNLTALSIAEVVTRSELNTTLAEIREKLKEDYHIDIHSDSTISKWRNVYKRYCVDLAIDPDRLSAYSIYKLNEIKDIVTAINVDEWLDLIMELTDKELRERLGKGDSDKASIVMDRVVYDTWGEARKDTAVACVGHEDHLSDVQFVEFLSHVMLQMPTSMKRKLWDAYHGDEEGETVDVREEVRQFKQERIEVSDKKPVFAGN